MGQRQVLQRFFKGLEKHLGAFNFCAIFDRKMLLNLKFSITKWTFFAIISKFTEFPQISAKKQTLESVNFGEIFLALT